MKFKAGWVMGLVAIFWFSSDPLTISIHPTTGIVDVYRKGTVQICATDTITTCFTVEI